MSVPAGDMPRPARDVSAGLADMTVNLNKLEYWDMNLYISLRKKTGTRVGLICSGFQSR